MKDSHAAPLTKLRSWRVRPDKNCTIGRDVAAQVRDATAQHKRATGAELAWETCAPEALRRGCTAASTGSGVLQLKARSAASRFQLDRWLKSGGEAALRSGGVRGVKLS